MDDGMSFRLFPSPSAVGMPELHWEGKRPFLDTPNCPVRLREAYGPCDGWADKLFLGDNLPVMGHLLEQFRGKVDLVYIDPPFSSRTNYKRKVRLRGEGPSVPGEISLDQRQYGDVWSPGEYLQFMYDRLLLVRELLSDTGSVYLHCDWHSAARLKLLMDEVFGPEHFLNEIAWCYQGTGRPSSHYKRKHDSLLFYSKGSRWKFNARAVGTPFGERQLAKYTGRDESGVYKAYRHADGRVYLKYLREDEFLPCNDWWSDIFVIQDHAERVGYPTQKPEALIERILLASSDPGDLVLDCFMGSGTTQAVSMKLGRRFIGVDINPSALHIATKRLLRERDLIAREDVPTGLEVYDAGDEAASSDPQAKVMILDGRLAIEGFFPAPLLEKLSLCREDVDDWRRLADSVMIDWDYDGTVLRPTGTDIPRGNGLVSGAYDVPENHGRVRVKLTDLLCQSFEVEV